MFVARQSRLDTEAAMFFELRQYHIRPGQQALVAAPRSVIQ